ncbi:MAG TPA: hypothetical protein VM844_00985 [Miltoncostaeaceae bacterium]|nr:hypothetical protein [Miltoncostaeaceae bacterium]
MAFGDRRAYAMEGVSWDDGAGRWVGRVLAQRIAGDEARRMAREFVAERRTWAYVYRRGRVVGGAIHRARADDRVDPALFDADGVALLGDDAFWRMPCAWPDPTVERLDGSR